MSTKPPGILTPAEFAIIEQAKRGYGANSALKSDGQGSTERDVFLKSVSKLFMLLALSYIQDPTLFDFTPVKTEAAKFTILEEVFKRICIHLLVPEKELSDTFRVMGTGSIYFRKFLKDYVLGQLITKYGGEPGKGIELMTIMCQSVKPEGNEFRFHEWSGKSIKSLGDKTIAKVKKLEKDFFEKILDQNGEPKYDKTWDIALNEYRQLLFDEEKKRQNGTTKQSATDDEESSLIMSDGWLPGGDHAWLAFVCFGPYGQAIFSTDRPYLLQSHEPATAADSDAGKIGHKENEQSAWKPVSSDSVADKLVEKLLHAQIRQHALCQFDQLWRDKCEELETKIKSAKDLMMTELDCLKYFQEGTAMHNIHVRGYLDRRMVYEALIGERDRLAGEKGKLRDQLLPKLIEEESKPTKRVKDISQLDYECSSGTC